MVLDSLNNTARYAGLHPLFQRAFDFIQSTDFNQLEDGRIELEGERLFVNVCSLVGKPKEEGVLETHTRYIDMQLPRQGIEKIGWKPTSELQEPTQPYNEQDDIAFFADRPTAYSKIRPGQFAIYFPEDAHAPGIGKTSIRKVIVKVEVAPED